MCTGSIQNAQSSLHDFRSDAIAAEPAENPLSVEDLATTVYHCLGIVADKELMAPGNRPVEIVDGGTVRKDLLA